MRRRGDGEPGVGLAFRHPKREVGFAAGRFLQDIQVRRLRSRLGQQVIEQDAAAGFRLTGNDAGPVRPQVLDRGNGERVAGRQHQPLVAPRPFDQHHVQAFTRASHRGPVVAAAFGVKHVQPADHRFPRRQPFQPVEAAARHQRQPATGFVQAPFEKRVVAAGQDRRRHGPVREFCAVGHPLVDQVLREQPLAGDPGAGDAFAAQQVIDFALLDAQVYGDLAGGHQLAQRTSPYLYKPAIYGVFSRRSALMRQNNQEAGSGICRDRDKKRGTNGSR